MFERVIYLETLYAVKKKKKIVVRCICNGKVLLSDFLDAMILLYYYGN